MAVTYPGPLDHFMASDDPEALGRIQDKILPRSLDLAGGDD
jgi:hypothetical protein